jgi:hypothetical protein
MKKLQLSLIAILFTLAAFSQTTVKQDAKGNFVPVSVAKISKTDSTTGKNFTTAKGEVYPVYVSVNGKLYIIRTSKKTGNTYRQYLKLN